MASRGSSSCNSASLMPSRPRRLFRWLASEREPRGCATSARTCSGCPVGQQVQLERGAAARADLVAQQRRRRIDQAAFHAGRGGDEFALAVELLKADRHRLERLARRSAWQSSRSSRRARRSRSWTATARPRRRRARAAAAPRRRRSRAAASWRRPAPAPPPLPAAFARRAAFRSAMRRRRVQPVKRWRMWNCTPVAAQAVQPGAQAAARLSCRPGTRGPKCRRKSRCPGRAPSRARACASKARSHGSTCARALAVARDERVEGFRMREIQAALAGQQKLAPGRGHGVEYLDRLRHGRDSTSAAISPAGPAPTTATGKVPGAGVA